jgi:hypothetical protein
MLIARADTIPVRESTPPVRSALVRQRDLRLFATLTKLMDSIGAAAVVARQLLTTSSVLICSPSRPEFIGANSNCRIHAIHRTIGHFSDNVFPWK